MPEAPSLYWHQADTQSILIDDQRDVWHAGIVKDILVTVPNGTVLVATDSGGVWSVSDTGTGIPLLDADKPDMWCLAPGPDGEQHIYAGGVGLYETDVSDSLPLLAWNEIPLTDINNNAIGTVYRMVVSAVTRRIVLATSSGVYWSEIKAAPVSDGCVAGCLAALFGIKSKPAPRPPYVWTPAKGLPSGGYSGAAMGPRTGYRETPSVAVAAWGLNPKTGLYGLFYGTWDASGDLVFKRADVRGVDATGMCYTPIAVCENFPARMYASASDSNGDFFVMLTSVDAGAHWSPVAGAVEGGPDGPKTLTDLCKGQGNDGGRPNNTLAVGPISPGRIAFGWVGGPFFSENSGATFTLIADGYDPNPGDKTKYEHLHADFHAFHFDRNDPDGQRVFIGSDGGIVRSDDLGGSFVSRYNQRLLNLQLLGTTALREWWGTLGVSPTVPGLLGAGSQDNGNLWCRVKQNSSPWVYFGGGDGNLMAFLQNGQVIHFDNGENKPQQDTWTGNGFHAEGVIPYVENHELHAPVFEPVGQPNYRNDKGQLLWGVAGYQSFVYGLFAEDNGGGMHWEYMGSPPIGLNVVTAVSSRDGHTIFVGVSGGRMFRLDPPDIFPKEMPVTPLPSPDGDPKRVINRIVMAHAGLAFASYNGDGSGSVLRWTGHAWDKTLGGFPNETIYAMELDVSDELPVLYIVTDNKVYGSADFGLTWSDVSAGLPRRPHGSDLRYAQDQDGHYLYLSTFGRSVWVANLLTFINVPPR